MNRLSGGLPTMHINHNRSKDKFRDRAILDLEDLLAQPTDKMLRPCHECQETCHCGRASKTCCCLCSAKCAFAAHYLSSDANRYPIESKVLPLVYAMASLRVVQPCWSCEGHYNALDVFDKKPQVWFYSDSAWYPNLIAHYLADLHFQKKLGYRWEVAMCPQAYKDEITFTIQPDLTDVAIKRLGQMQADIAVIAENLVVEMQARSKKHLALLKKAGSTT